MAILTSSKPRRLSKLHVAEVSIVDRGSNPGAHVRLRKAAADRSGMIALAKQHDTDGHLAGMSDAEILQRGIDNARKSDPRLRPLGDEAVLDAIDGMMKAEIAKAAPPTAPLTRENVAWLWNHEVAETAKRFGIGKSEAVRELLKTGKGRRMFDLMDDQTLPAAVQKTADLGYVGHTVSTMHRALIAKAATPAHDKAVTMAKAFRESEAHAGRRLSEQQAYAAVLKRDLALRDEVMGEERASVAKRRIA